MTRSSSHSGFTVLEMAAAVAILCVLVGVYYVMVDSYKARRYDELAAKALMQAARAQEEFFAKEHYYFDAQINGDSGDAYLTTPDGAKTSVLVPRGVALRLRATDKQRREFEGSAFYVGSEVAHTYSSRTGKISTSVRGKEEAG
jgi:prepilin-type N-terminal cleavage/methylation domain-containing protein